MATSISINTLADSDPGRDTFWNTADLGSTTLTNVLIRASTMRRILESRLMGPKLANDSIPFTKMSGSIADTQISSQTIYGSVPPTGKIQHIRNNTIGPINLTHGTLDWTENGVGVGKAGAAGAANGTSNFNLDVKDHARIDRSLTIGSDSYNSASANYITLIGSPSTNNDVGKIEFRNAGLASNTRSQFIRLNAAGNLVIADNDNNFIARFNQDNSVDVSAALNPQATGSKDSAFYRFFSGSAILSNTGLYYNSSGDTGIGISNAGTERVVIGGDIRFKGESITVNSIGNRLVSNNLGAYSENDGTRFHIKSSNNNFGFGTGGTSATFFSARLDNGRMGIGGLEDTDTDSAARLHVTGNLRVSNNIFANGFTVGASNFTGHVTTNQTNFTADQQLVTKKYVDEKVPVIPDLGTTYLKLDGTNRMAGFVIIDNNGPRFVYNDTNHSYGAYTEVTTNSFYLARTSRSGSTINYQDRTQAVITIDLNDRSSTDTTPRGTFLLRGEFRATGNVVAFFTSDEKLKENIKLIDSPLEKIKKLRGVEFDWKDEEIENRGGEDGLFVRKHDVGVIAQEVKEVLPEAVALRPDEKLGVSYEKLVPLLIEAIKELSDKVKNLESKLNN